MVQPLNGDTLFNDSFQKYHPTKILAFITCLNRTPSNIGKSLSYTLHCADRARIRDYVSVIQPCAESDDGLNLLLDSADRCNLLDTHTSATIRVAGKNVCVRDDEKWKECGQLLSMGGGNVALGLQKLIEKEWNKLNGKGVYLPFVSETDKCSCFGNWDDCRNLHNLIK